MNTYGYNSSDEKFSISFPISDTVLLALLTAAFEGGSNYWYADVEKYCPPATAQPEDSEWAWWEWNPVYGGAIVVKTQEDGNCALGRMDLEIGMTIMAQKYPRHFADAVQGNEDAVTGDVFLQCCLFRDVVYG